MKFIIEHMEPELFDWCSLEYEHISSFIGKENLIFTNVPEAETETFQQWGEVHHEPFHKLTFDNICLLDPLAKEQLTPQDCKKMDYVLFGGILGDFPPRKRTGKLSEHFKGISRNLGTEQMATDNAVRCVQLISQGKTWDSLHFQEGADIDIQEGEQVHLPFRYLVEQGKPFLSPKLIQYIIKNPF